MPGWEPGRLEQGGLSREIRAGRFEQRNSCREIRAGRSAVDLRFWCCEIARRFGLNPELHEKAKTQPADSRVLHGGSESLVQEFISSGYGCWGAMKRGRARAIGALSIPSPAR